MLVQFISTEWGALVQFIATHTNKRTDEWGGAYENRIRYTKHYWLALLQHCASVRVGGLY